MALIGKAHNEGPSRMASTMASRIAPLTTASGCLRNLRQASSHGEKCRARRRPGAAASPVSDSGIEPAIDDVCDEVEEDHETGEDERNGHDNRGVVGQDRADQQRSD